MIALGLGTMWAGYYLLMYGYCLVRGYNVTFSGLAHSTWPGGVPTGAGSGGGGSTPKAA